MLLVVDCILFYRGREGGKEENPRNLLFSNFEMFFFSAFAILNSALRRMLARLTLKAYSNGALELLAAAHKNRWVNFQEVTVVI